MTTQYVSYRPGGSGGSGSAAIGGNVSGGTDGAILFIHPAGILAQDATNLSFNGVTGVLTLGLAPKITAFSTAGIVHNSAAGLLSSSLVVDADVSATAAIARTKIASGTNYRILANSATGVMSENAALTAGRVVYPDANGQLTGEAAFAYNAATDTLTVVNLTGSGTFTNPGVGLLSEQFGASANAVGGGAVSIGNSASAPGDHNISIGYNAFSAADGGSIAIGGNASIASAIASVGIGDSVSITGDFTTAIGAQSQAQSGQATAVGYQAYASNVAVAVGDSSNAVDGGVAVGSGAYAPGGAVSIGSGASGADSSVSIGASASGVGASVVAIGNGASASGDNTVAVGAGSVASGPSSVAINGSSAYDSSVTLNGVATAPYQFVVGSSTTPITSVYLGSGVTGGSTQPVTLTLTGQTTSNTAASDFTIAAARSAGNATPAGLVFQAGTAGASGTTPQTLTTVARMDQNGLTLSKQALQLNPYTTGSGNTSEIRFMELAVNGTNYVGFKSPDAITTNKIWVLPSADGAADTLLSTNGSGTLAFTLINNANVGASAAIAGSKIQAANGASNAGVVSTSAQNFGGTKSLLDGIITGTGGTANSTSDSNLGTIATVTQTAYYEGAFSATFTGPFNSNQGVTIGYIKIGKQVTLKIPSIIAAAGVPAGSVTTTTAAVPSALRPVANVGSVSVPVKNNSVDSATPGAIRIQSSGSIDIYRDWPGTNWSATGNCGWGMDLTITYFVT